MQDSRLQTRKTMTHAMNVATAIPFDGTNTVPTDSFKLPVEPLTKTLYSYQLAATEKILDRKRVILGLQPGMGKTAIMQAVAAARANDGFKTLIVTPPMLRVMWQDEFRRDFPDVKVELITGGKSKDFPDCDVALISDSIVGKRLEDILYWGPDGLIIDEAHRMKNPSAKRTKAVLELSDALADDAVVVTATGTLATNTAGDVYCPLRVTGSKNAAKVSGTDKWNTFLDMWCETTIAWKRRVVVGCKDVEGLREELLNVCMVNIARDEVLDLPERTFSHVSLVLDPKAQAEYAVVQKHFLEWVQEQFGEDAMLRAGKAEAITKLMRLWEIDGKVKNRASAEYIKDLVDQGEPVVVMAQHTSVINGLVELLEGYGMNVGKIAGGMTPEDKADIVNWFQDGLLDVVVGQIEAAGVGLTLHASCHIVFAQLPWSPATFAQATDRIYRIGQERKCTVHVLNMVDGVSEKLWGVLKAKSEVVDGINNGKATTIDPGSVVSSVLESYGYY